MTSLRIQDAWEVSKDEPKIWYNVKKKSKVTTKKSLDITVREKWHLMHLGRNYLNGDRFHFRDHGRQDKFVVIFQDLEK